MEDLTFNDIPRVLASVSRSMDYLVSQVGQLQAELAELKGNMSEPSTGLSCGIFAPNEMARMSDSRLWEGERAPFATRSEVYKAKERGCPFLTPGGRKSYRIKASDLEEWLNQGKLRRKLRI